MPVINGFGSTSVDNTTIETNISGQIQVKNGGITADKLDSAVIDENGFIYIDTATITHTGVSTKKRTYTINKACDMLKYSFAVSNDTTATSAYIRFYKNGVQISETLIYPQSGMHDTSANIQVWYPNNNYVNIFGSMTLYYPGLIFIINDSFNATDTFEIYIQTTSTNILTMKKMILQGIKNKSSDTTWISVS